MLCKTKSFALDYLVDFCVVVFFSLHVNFMLNISELWFLQNSRLHFIGTWRNRYRKRFPNVSIGFKSTNSNLNGHTDSQKTAIIHIDMVFFKSSSRKIRFNSDFQFSYTLGVITECSECYYKDFSVFYHCAKSSLFVSRVDVIVSSFIFSTPIACQLIR